MAIDSLDTGTVLTLILAVLGPIVAFMASNAVTRSRVDEHRQQLKELWTWRDDTFARVISIEKDLTGAREDVNRIGQNLRRLDDRLTTHFNGTHGTHS